MLSVLANRQKTYVRKSLTLEIEADLMDANAAMIRAGLPV
jgi:hypothetical protein